MQSEPILVLGQLINQTLAAVLRGALPGQSWSQVRRLIEARRVQVNQEPCLDDARRLKEGDRIDILPESVRRPPLAEEIVIRHLDRDLVVVEKPAGISTVRHPAERDWKDRRRALSPTLEDLVRWQIARGNSGRQPRAARPRLRIVHRLDKETSGLVVFARTVPAEQGLGKQFQRHTVIRKYLAIVPGHVKSQTVRSFLVRDRGDGRRGSAPGPSIGKEAITHLEVIEQLPRHTLLSCRLETGRTHQIRIHLAELGHPVCGEKVYNRKPGSPPQADPSGAPHLALHATELGFIHPATGEALHWSMPLPADLRQFLDALRAVSGTQSMGQRASRGP